LQTQNSFASQIISSQLFASLSLTHTCTHARTHMHTNTRTLTHTHTRTLSLSQTHTHHSHLQSAFPLGNVLQSFKKCHKIFKLNISDKIKKKISCNIRPYSHETFRYTILRYLRHRFNAKPR